MFARGNMSGKESRFFSGGKPKNFGVIGGEVKKAREEQNTGAAESDGG